MPVDLRICAQDVVGNEEMVVSQLFNGLNEGANRPEIGADFGLGKNGSNFHGGDSLARLLPLAIWRPDVGSSSAGPLRSLRAPVCGGLPELEQVWGLRMGLEGCLILVHLVEPDAVGIIRILNDIKPQTSWLVAYGAAGVLCDGLDKPILIPFLNLDWGDDDVHNCLL